MATVYYTASSLDGYIVDEADSLDWLTSRDIDADGPFGYERVHANPSAHWSWARRRTSGCVTNHPGEWMYEQPSWVLTHRPHIVAEGHPVQTFDGDVAELHPKLVAAAAGKDVWVVGGGDVAAQFVTAGLVDEMIVSYTPCSLGGGSRVLPIRSEWALVESGVNGDFVCARWRKA